MSGRVTVNLDGRQMRASRGEMLLDVARRNHVAIPTLCHVEGLPPQATCRLCLVELRRGRSWRVVTSCDLPVSDGMVIRTDTERLRRMRAMVMALHVARAPSSPELVQMARELGLELPRGLRSADPDEKCILCGLCQSVCAHVVGAHAVGLAGRGSSRRVTLPFDEQDASGCIGCGACSHVCPTGCIEIESWALDRLRARHGQDRPCRYALMGLAPSTLCPHDYRCATCQVDHEMYDLAGGRHPVFLKGDGGGR